MTAARDRAFLLLQQGRLDLAEPELRRALADDPGDAEAHALLAYVLTDLDRAGEALDEANSAVGLAPDLPLAHLARSGALLHLDRAKDAEAAAREAIRLDPGNADAFAALAAALTDRRQRQEALDAAEQALALDPEHPGATNLRAIALTRLGRRDEAAGALEGALSRDPENAVSHANRGWTLLHQNDVKGAMLAFREALRLEPGNEWARSGILEAMKARNPVYRGLLAYFLWMDRLSSGQRWGVIIGGYLAARFIPLLWIVYLPVVLLTWTGDSFFSLLLLLDPFGRLVLNREEKIAAGLVGGCLIGGLALSIAGVAGAPEALFPVGLGLMALAIPVAGTARQPARKRRLSLLYTAALAMVGAFAAYHLLANPMGTTHQLLGGIYVLGVVAYTWLGNLLVR